MTLYGKCIATLVVLGVAAPAQNRPDAFVLDTSRPYVYIAFDHVGPREPVEDGEVAQGLWLRLVNNCRIPIQVLTHDPGTGDAGVAIDYDVVWVTGNIDTPAPATKPPGYSSHVGSTEAIEPGGSVLFSVPRDNIGKWWFLQTRFDFVLPPPRSGSHPFGSRESQKGSE